MSYVYLVRHAQAGTRDNYDVLSDMGREQARLLGRHLVDHQIELDAVYCGGMRRQKETAEIACEVITAAGGAKPEIVADERWNEFSLISVYRAIAKRMMGEDEAFARDIKEMQEAIKADPHATGGAVGRCDQAVIRAWMEGRYPEYEGETWSSFSSATEYLAYQWALSTPVEPYKPSPQNLASLIQALQDDRFEPDPFIVRPDPPPSTGAGGEAGAGGEGALGGAPSEGGAGGAG